LREVGERFDLGELCLALLLAERIERVLEEVLVGIEAGACRDAIVVLKKERSDQ
jgi:hypothetical protein